MALQGCLPKPSISRLANLKQGGRKTEERRIMQTPLSPFSFAFQAEIPCLNPGKNHETNDWLYFILDGNWNDHHVFYG